MSTPVAALPRRRDLRIIGLISAGHFFSHFYMLLLPPLFPLLRDVYGVGYTELGLAITVFSLLSGLTQTPVGFLVDRYGAGTLLIAGVLLESVAILLIGVFPFYGALLALMALAGLANSVYHPADYAILNAAVDPARMGRGFSLHTFSGYLGNALAPLTILALMRWLDWRQALIVCGLAGVVVALLMLSARATLAAGGGGRSQTNPVAGDGGVRVLLSAPILLGLLFFAALAMSSHGFGDFGVASLTALFDLPLERAGLILSAYLFAAPLGVLAGGAVADRVRHHERVVIGCFVVVALAVAAVASLPLGPPAVAFCFALAGFASGLVAPSRDMMIRAVTPPGQTGKVFGFVSTGFNVGGMLAPPLFGYLLDRSGPQAVFWALAAVSLLTILLVARPSGGRNTAAGADARP